MGGRGARTGEKSDANMCATLWPILVENLFRIISGLWSVGRPWWWISLGIFRLVSL